MAGRYSESGTERMHETSPWPDADDNGNHGTTEAGSDDESVHPGAGESREESLSPFDPTVTKGFKYSVYDSDEDGNDKEEHRPLPPNKATWDSRAVRKCARSEFMYPGSTWKSSTFRAIPPAVAAESRMAGSTKQKNFNSANFVRIVKGTTRCKRAHRLSSYLAAEITAHLTVCNDYDVFWTAAHDMEEYIRQAIWPQLMQMDAVRLQRGLRSKTVELAKCIPPPRAPGFSNDRFWGFSVYLALRFPAGLHPFTTPVVRNSIAYFRRCLTDHKNPWGADPTTIKSQMAMAATWAGYHISRHLINRNIYDMSDEEVQRQKTQLDTLVWLGCLQVPHLRALFEGVLRENGDMDMDKPVESLQQEMYHMQWDRFVGACHRVGYNWERSLPLPLCKPSRLLREMRASSQLPDDWDHETVFTEEFDEPLDPSSHTFKDAYPMVLAQNVTAKVEKINAWLLAFLRRQAPRDDVTSAEFSYMPPEAFPDEDDRRPAEPPSTIVKMEIPLEQIQMDISLLKTSVARVEVAVAETRERHAETLRKITEMCERVTELHEKAGEANPPSHNLSDTDLDALARRVAPALLGILQPGLTKTMETSLEANMEQARDAAKSIMSDAATSIMDSNNARAAEAEKSMEQHYSQSTARMAELKKSVEKHCSHQTARTDELKKSMDQHYAQNTARTVELRTSMEEHFSHHTARTTELKTSMDHHYSQNTVRAAELKKSMEQHCSQALQGMEQNCSKALQGMQQSCSRALESMQGLMGPLGQKLDKMEEKLSQTQQLLQPTPGLDKANARPSQIQQTPRPAPMLRHDGSVIPQTKVQPPQPAAALNKTDAGSSRIQQTPRPMLRKDGSVIPQTNIQPSQPAAALNKTDARPSQIQQTPRPAPLLRKDGSVIPQTKVQPPQPAAALNKTDARPSQTQQTPRPAPMLRKDGSVIPQTNIQTTRPAAALNSQTEQAPRPPGPATAFNDTAARPSQVSAQTSQSAPPLDKIETRASQSKAQPPESAPTLDRAETRSSQSKAQPPGSAPTLDRAETRSSQTGAQPQQPAPATRNTKHRHSDAGPVIIDLESPAPYFTRSKKDRFPAGRHSDAGAVLIDLEAPAPYYTRSKKDLFAAGRHSDVGPVVVDLEHAAPYYTRSKRDRASSGRLSEGTRVHRDDDDEALSTSTPPLIKRSKLFSGGAVPENPLAQPTKTPQQLKQEYVDTYWRDQAAMESESVSVKRPPSEEPSFEQAQKRQKSVRFGL